MRIFIKLVLGLALFFSFSVYASAAPVRIVDGLIIISNGGTNINGTNVNIRTDSVNISVNREGPYKIPSIGSVTPAGTIIPNAINILQYTILGGTGGLASGRIVDGGSFNDIRIDSTQSSPSNFLTLTTTQPLVVPNFTGNIFTTSIPFTLLANFQVNCLDSLSCQSIDNRNYAFTGNGNAEFTFSRDSDGNITYESAAYSFASTAQPTPEPATLLLLGTGLTGIAAYAKRKRRTRQTE